MDKSNNEGKAKKHIEGKVTSDKMEKTVVVAVNTMKTHPKYLKRYLVTRKYKAHDPENRFHVGDKVKIQETRPMSKGKKWEVIY
ncbi:MAG: 30S ribosomal protein S17 [Candidatus Moranbacteria bacterium]|nr:30S ribosomal protein S17 [Candidatus Moranbacteria bacterium]